MTGGQLLGHARAVLDGIVRIPGLGPPRAAALLARQALEDVVRDRCRAIDQHLSRASMRSCMICLRAFGGEDVGRTAQLAWDGLSRACHHHAFELTPTDAEVRRLIDMVDAVIGDSTPISLSGLIRLRRDMTRTSEPTQHPGADVG